MSLNKLWEVVDNSGVHYLFPFALYKLPGEHAARLPVLPLLTGTSVYYSPHMITDEGQHHL